MRTPQKIFRRFPLQGTAGDDLSNDDGEKETDGGDLVMIFRMMIERMRQMGGSGG